MHKGAVLPLKCPVHKRRFRNIECVMLRVNLFIVDLSVFRAVRSTTAQQGHCI